MVQWYFAEEVTVGYGPTAFTAHPTGSKPKKKIRDYPINKMGSWLYFQF